MYEPFVFPKGFWRRSLLLILCLIATLGCQEVSRTTLHEDDHQQPDHWPSGLLDAAQKIEARLPVQAAKMRRKSDRENTEFVELRELLGWIPEIAADNDLTEVEWMPIYQSSETLLELVNTTAALNDAVTIDAFQQLCTQLRSAHELCQQRAPSMEESQNATDPTIVAPIQEPLQ